MKTKTAKPKLLSIGALSKETGIHSSTIRIWESRYGAVEPSRTEGGARRYSAQDAQRLKWMKALVDAGHKPSALARMTLDELKAEFTSASATAGAAQSGERISKIGMFADADWGGTLPGSSSSAPRLEFQHAGDTLTMEQRLGDYDAVVVFFRGLQLSAAEKLAAMCRQQGYRSMLVVYEFSNTSALKHLKDHGLESLKHPVASDVLVQTVEYLCSRTHAAENRRAPQYSMAELQAINVADNNLLCECPKHLSSLLMSLHGFIDYTSQCADESPAEAVIHQRLREFAMSSIVELESGLRLALGTSGGNGV